jgi:hypothetical protein
LGQRFCSQTTNPKLSYEHWNKPKKSTYVTLAVIYRTVEDGYIHWAGYNTSRGEEPFANFLKEFGSGLTSKYQKIRVASLHINHARYRHHLALLGVNNLYDAERSQIMATSDEALKLAIAERADDWAFLKAIFPLSNQAEAVTRSA